MNMKKTMFGLLAAMAVAGVFTLGSCQVAELVISGTTYYDTEITTKDNQLITGRIGGQRSSNLVTGSKKISIKTDEGRKKIKSEDIQYMKLSRKGHPEKQQTLVYLDFRWPYTKKGQQKYIVRKAWQVVESVGDHLLITATGHSFSLAKDGSLVVTYSRDEGIKYCLQRHGDEGPIYFANSNYGKSSMRKAWQNYLADDSVLCQKIANKEIAPFNFKEIAEQYNPKK